MLAQMSRAQFNERLAADMIDNREAEELLGGIRELQPKHTEHNEDAWLRAQCGL